MLLAGGAMADLIIYNFTLDAGQEVPPNGSTGTGTAVVALNTTTNALSWSVSFQGLTAAPTAAHFHGPAAPGVNAGVVVNIGVATNPIVGSATITEAQETQITDGLWYVNIHTPANPGGEIRGQVANPASLLINEIRVDQPSTDNDEYFEIRGGAGTNLDGLTYLVIGDGTGASGVIESVTALTGQVIPADGHFLAAESTHTLAPGEINLNAGASGLNFENSDNVTHLLVAGFSGTNGQDLDTNDDGVLDVTPWTGVIDAVGLIGTAASEFPYGAALGFVDVGPDGTFVPGHVYRCETAGDWTIGAFDPAGGNDSPGTINDDCPGACCLPDGTCLDGQSIVDCALAGGLHQGGSSVCALIFCPVPCVGDFDNSGDVGFGDLLQLLAVWGPCAGCPEDLDGDNDVGFNDLLQVLSLWGPCP